LLEFSDVLIIPEIVSYGYRDYKVKEHIAPPLRCLICQRFGHRAADCRSAVPRCPRCSKNHSWDQCRAGNDEIKCVNCGLFGHSAAYKGCARYKWVQDNIKADVRTNRPYSELFKENRADLQTRIEASRLKAAGAVTVEQVEPVRAGPLLQTPTAASTVDIQGPPSTATKMHLGHVSAAVTAPVLSVGKHIAAAIPPTGPTSGPTSASASINSSRSTLTPARAVLPAPVPAGQVLITVDKLIALIINLLQTTGGQISADKVKTCIDNALQFLGVTIQFGPASHN